MEQIPTRLPWYEEHILYLLTFVLVCTSIGSVKLYPFTIIQESSHAFPLAVAAQVGHIKTVERLLKERVDINKQNGVRDVNSYPQALCMSLCLQNFLLEFGKVLVHA